MSRELIGVVRALVEQTDWHPHATARADHLATLDALDAEYSAGVEEGGSVEPGSGETDSDVAAPSDPAAADSESG